MSSKLKKMLSLAERMEAKMKKSAQDANAFYGLLRNYEQNSEALKDFMAGIVMIAEDYKREADMNNPIDARIYSLLLKQSQSLENALEDMKFLDEEIQELTSEANSEQ